jgi:hypothetical protein
MGNSSLRFREACDFRIRKHDRVRKNRAGTKESFVIE